MSVTLTPPIRVFAFVGVLAVIGLAAFLVLLRPTERDGTTPATTSLAKPAKTPGRATPRSPKAPRATARTALATSGLPLPIRRVLRRNRVAVVVAYIPGADVDALVRREAKAGARSGRAGYIAVSALSERLMRPLLAKTGVLPDPAVLVLRRPGVVTATLSVTDAETVAQAVAQARR